MATKKEDVTEVKTDTEEKVTVTFPFIPGNGKYSRDIVVGVNGVTWQIKRGEEVTIPKYVKEIVDDSDRRDAAIVK